MRPLHTPLLALALFLALGGCHSQPPAAEPSAPVARVEALPAVVNGASASPAPCLAQGDRPDPFVIDWPSDRRGDLEVALKRGVVVLDLSCTSARILPDCSAEGAYSFIGTTEREELVSLQTPDEVRANLPLLPPALTGPSGIDFQHGSSVDVAIATIGRRSASRASISRAELKGECRDATHFVRAATIGAFAMGAGARGQAKAVADLFGRGAVGGVQMAKDGSLQACRTATPDAETEVAQCGAPVRLQLKAIRTEPAGPLALAKAPPVQAPTCPRGMVQGDTGACQTPSPERAHVCAMADIADCAQQCDHGSPTSCAILGRSYQIGRGVPADLARASDLLTKACTGGATVACGRLGEMALAAHDEEKGLRLLKDACSGGWMEGCQIAGAYAVKHASPGVKVASLFRRACRGGEPESCWSLGALYTDGVGVSKSDVEAARWLSVSCEGDAKLGCAYYARLVDAGRGVPADPARAVALLTTACDGGHASACADLASDYFTGHSVPRDAARGMALLERGCTLGDNGTCFAAGRRRQMGAPGDAAAAIPLLTKACQGGIAQACALLPKP